jgi:energy-coupling factor transport system ATP-binding protein
MPEEEVKEAVVSALKLVNMEPYIYRATHTLSGGQRQRVAIAGAKMPLSLPPASPVIPLPPRTHTHAPSFTPSYSHFLTHAHIHTGSLAENPRLLLLDELTTFLDVEDQFGVLEAVRNITRAKNDVTAIWVTHRFEELEYADAASYMSDGKVVFTGRPARMKEFLRKLGAPVDMVS